MNMVLKSEEKAVFTLRALYHSYGYAPYKMSKFEEYDFYVKNKNFLISGDILSFTDLNGRLLAMKPDVTLSIVKNFKESQCSLQKLYYDENVYRAAPGTHEFREITQTGLECMGDIDVYLECEVIMLAAKSLEEISLNYILDISSVGIIGGLFSEISAPEPVKEKIATCIKQKNLHNLIKQCNENNISTEITERLKKLAFMYGPLGEKLPELKSLCLNEEMKDACNELEIIYNTMEKCGLSKNINLDFSVITDMNYYNGVVFKGYIDGLPESVLSGGRYDNLLEKMGKRAGAIGFAVYLDKLERLDKSTDIYDADLLITYEDGVAPDLIMKYAEEFTAKGQTVRVQKLPTDDIKCRLTVRITAEGVQEND
ncbi:MAG: ATP phosphoribosyltransferase regulatory subunit [Bacillota bacterium]|nr:ATP phosphoribosyltransferase regulatory subunit [Bacillota bacterium]